MYRSSTLLILLSFALLSVCAQQPAYHWYFGDYAGLRFDGGGPPTVLTNGKMSTLEGVSAISDNQGALLFYTEGTRIWNRQHTVMPNGTGLSGNFSTTQSALTIPKIDDPQRYYVFTLGAFGYADGLKYNIVNMALNSGLGDVEVKNVPLLTPVCEKITALKHCNGHDIWVIVHAFNSDAFYAYLVTSAGIRSPVVSFAGSFVSDAQSYHATGCMKVSPDGKRLAAAHSGIGVDLLDFDSNTGIVSNGESLFLPGEPYGNAPGAYGIEFSPNTQMLYVTAQYFDNTDNSNADILMQYNLTLPNINAIRNSRQTIYKRLSGPLTGNFGALQLTPEGKIYMAEVLQTSLSVINKPDQGALACQFAYAQLPIGYTLGGMSMYGLPSFIQSYFRPGFIITGSCNGNLMQFKYKRTVSELSVKWDFGDPASGVNNTSTLDSCSHVYAAEGIYTVSLIRYTNCGSDTITNLLHAGSGYFDLGNDTIICSPSYTLAPQVPGSNIQFLWQNGSTAPTFTATQDGRYLLEVTNANNGCSTKDSIYLFFRPPPLVNLGPDIDKCEGAVTTLHGPPVADFYTWSNGAAADSLIVTTPGTYWLDVMVNGCMRRDSIRITDHVPPIVNLGSDTTVCEATALVLDAQNAGMQYKWQDQSANRTFRVRTPGTYSVKVNNVNCIVEDSIRVDYLAKPRFSLGPDAGICLGMTILLQPAMETGAQYSYTWSNGTSDSSIRITQPGVYALTLSNTCGTKTDEVEITKGACVIYVPGAFTPNGDGTNDVLKTFYGEHVTEFDFRIHNRWGETVFATNNIKTGWNGTFKGQLQNSDVYIWHIRFKTVNDDTEKMMKGTVLLIR